jgi:hypothetical protein
MVDRLRHSPANQKRIENIETCFGAQGEPLWQEGRVLVGEGVLMKMCRKKAKPRQFFLLNDLLVYGSIIISKKRYHKQRIIPLEQVQLGNLEDEANVKHGWIIKTRMKSFAVYAATETEKQEWMLHIERCVQDLIKNGKRPESEHAAVWIPDNEAPVCMCCKISEFSLIHRRHHCRSCGHVVCGNCSTKRFVLPGIDRRPVRVCDTCYAKLVQGDVTVVVTNANTTNNISRIESDDSEDEDETDKHVNFAEDNQAQFYGGEEAQKPISTRI